VVALDVESVLVDTALVILVTLVLIVQRLMVAHVAVTCRVDSTVDASTGAAGVTLDGLEKVVMSKRSAIQAVQSMDSASGALAGVTNIGKGKIVLSLTERHQGPVLVYPHLTVSSLLLVFAVVE
jgi:hypothetical protein